ncbi:hypothetical protein ACM0A0_24345 [Mycobacteroides abscessus subsp. abscessus]|uniref:hypothetical protein n=1 Tax=Mycobacteroides abscessus TaxID=36809 RepID=UPI0002E5BBA9|nr:hypothetical protein [Mycobacteroides abscessus]BBZ85197.1 hypothetical protein MABM_51130 [Mycobacteroides abscessus]BBZ85318.1 hypothetical protein MABM_52340 [Mycobacteroides abscessus]
MDPAWIVRILIISTIVGAIMWYIASDLRGVRQAARRHRWLAAKWPRMQQLRQEERDQRQALSDLGFDDDELRWNHMLTVDPETGISTAVYIFPQEEVAARAELLMRRYVAAYSG